MLHLVFVTPEKVIFEGEVVSVNVPGSYGYFEVLQNHAPIISSLKPGRCVIRDKNSNKLTFAVSGGFFEMSNNEAALLADAAERPSEIDVQRAKASIKKAEKILESHEPEMDIDRAKESLARAKNRIKIASEK